MKKQKLQKAAFFRAEGILVNRGVLMASAYLAANSEGFADRLVRLGQLAVSAPFTTFLKNQDRSLSNRMTYMVYKGMTKDRIEVLCDEYFNDILKEHVLETGISTLKKAHTDGYKIVLVSESVRAIAKKLAQYLGCVDYALSNHLEFEKGEATGKLLSPIIGGYDSGKLLNEFATEHGIDLAKSMAYAASGADLLFLAAVGQPCAVNPDFALRRAASQANWPVMEFQN